MKIKFVALSVLALLFGCQSTTDKPAADQTAATDHFKQLADLPFEGGYPTAAAAKTLDEELYFQRATQIYLWSLPAVNMFAMKEGLGKTFGEGYNVISVFEKRLKPKT